MKNDFAVAFAFGAVAFASEDSPVFQRKDSLHSRSGGVDFTDFIRDCSIGQARNAKLVWKSRRLRLSAEQSATSLLHVRQDVVGEYLLGLFVHAVGIVVGA